MRYPLVLLAAGLVAAVAAPAQAESAEAGRPLYVVCASCHGADAGGNPAQGAPRLNHLAPVYLSTQLEKFRSGLRGGESDSPRAQAMAAMAKSLPDDQALYAVSDYIASLDSPVSPVTVSGDSGLGGDYYRQLCGACHGADAMGNKALHSPRLAGSDDWYLESQLHAFREGSRGSTPADLNGRQMRAMAATLPDDQAVRDVVSYLRSLAK
ncbi:c-type cytochrome [Haliea sp. E17]|uniref:c-type cytochrome n=1 Tax=Haliea sp. E17 TaxID=3401576 RepID=UPI003AAE1D80